ncbi:hypothetical protein ACFQYP_14540 [Nonomuraea antimicrobica]
MPTLDDTWSDFGGGAGVECRTLRTPDGRPVDVTYGPHGEQRVGDGPWTPSEWSSSRGLRKDPVHRETLGPKGRVPLEFLSFGHVPESGEARFRAVVTVPSAGWVMIGAGAAKTLWLDGVERPLDDRGHAAVSRATVPPGEHLLELLLVPEEELDLRAYVCVVAEPPAPAPPEWIAGTSLETVVHVGVGRERAAPGGLHLRVPGAGQRDRGGPSGRLRPVRRGGHPARAPLRRDRPGAAGREHGTRRVRRLGAGRRPGGVRA